MLTGVLLRVLIIWIATKARFFNISHEISFVMVSCVYMLAFQYIVVPIMSPADLRDRDTEFSDIFFYNGLYSDFNSGWF